MANEFVKCQDCIFWLKDDKVALQEDNRFCYANPPNSVAIPILSFDEEGKITGISSNIVPVLPVTYKDHKCGQGKLDSKRLN